MTGQPWNIGSAGGPGNQGSGIAYGAPANGCKAMTTGTAYPAGRGVFIDCTTTGNIVLTFVDATQITVNMASATVYQFNWAITTVVSKTATCTTYLLF